MSDQSGLPHLDQSRFAASLLFILTIIAVGMVFKLTASIVQPLVIALLLSFVLNPLVEFLRRLRLPRVAAILIVIALLLAFGSLVAYILYSSAQSVVRRLPGYLNRLVELVERMLVYFELPREAVSELNLTREIGGYLVSFSGSFLSVLGSLAMVLVFLLFILLEKPYLRPKVMEALHGPRTEKLWRIVGHTNAQIGRYLTVKLFVSTVTGLLVWGSFSVIGVEFAFVWGVLSVLFNFIPSIGSIVIGVVSSLFALVQFYPDPSPIIAAAASMLTIQFVLGNVIDPKLQGDSLKISPVVILFSLLFWGWLWGIVGMFLAVPLTVALKIVFENIPGYESIGVLMGRTASEDPGSGPADGTV